MDSLNQEVIKLDDQRKEIENEVANLVEFLEAPGNPGISGSLIDAEGFPVPNIDHMAVLKARQRFNMLSNDLKDLNKIIEGKLAEYFQNVSSSSTEQRPSIKEEEHEMQAIELEQEKPIQSIKIPFADVESVVEGSPADEAGLIVGDEIVRFDHIRYGTPNALQKIAYLVSQKEGQNIEVEVIRSTKLEMSFAEKLEYKIVLLKPHQWSGKGLLGCALKIK